ncbi:MAG: redoxin domain-containing protein [Akkermansia sp.]|nr:redoxin domain-containing protein [Akkermansia sp.]
MNICIDSAMWICYSHERMKILGFLSVLSGALTLLTQPVWAAPAASVSEAIEQTDFVTDHKPNVAAKHYMYIYSASWCTPCRAVMPKIVAAYPEMMTNRELEIILVSCDETPEEAKKYLAHYHAPFAAVMYDSPAAHKLPGCAHDIRSIPTMIIVNARGEELFRGSGRLFANWRQYISQK